MTDLKATVVAHARACGFDLVGVTSADDFVADRDVVLERVREGRMDGLPWYTESRVLRGTNPGELLPGARSVVCLGLSYLGEEEPDGWRRPSVSSGRTGYDTAQTGGGPGPQQESSGPVYDAAPLSGRVARYAWVRDYHRVMKRRMRDFVRSLERELGSSVAARWYVDDGPMLDRAAANRAGIGWFGKNTNILTSGFGSWVFLGQVITDLGLEPDVPLKKSCGACVRCIEDCPTGAIVAPYVVDNARCISYLTIENRGTIPLTLRPLMQDWVFGCDICQDVCPVNRKAQPAGQPIPFPESAKQLGTLSGSGYVKGMALLDLVELLEMSDDDFRSRFAGTPVMRAKRVGMQRNACVALGNLGDPSAVPALGLALRQGEPLVRRHAAWGLGRIGGAEAVALLSEAAGRETDADVLDEIQTAQGTALPEREKGLSLANARGRVAGQPD